jgi:hypothetical protein
VNGEAEAQFERKVQQLVAAVETCLAANLWEPTLILLYAGIDAMAWLDRPAGQLDVTENDFVRWAERYLLSSPSPGLTGEDLYGARCGLLHSHTGESRKHRILKVRKLFYHREVNGKRVGVVQLRMNEKFLPPSVDLDAFVRAFRDAVRKFREDFEKDAERRDQIYDRVLGSYLSEVQYTDERTVTIPGT